MVAQARPLREYSRTLREETFIPSETPTPPVTAARHSVTEATEGVEGARGPGAPVPRI